MKRKGFRRVLSLILSLALVLSLLSAMTVFAVTGTLSHNTATRHQVCTALSDQAEAYYTGSYTYDRLSALSGVSSPTDSWATTQNNPLYTALQTLMTNTHTVYSRYNPSGEQSDELSYLWDYTDSVGSASQYQYFYTDISADSYGTANMQREHVWPKSNASYYELNGGADLHHLRPSIGGVNSAKSNNTFGNIASTGNAYQVNGVDVIWTGSSMLEVRDNIKGDVARILLYVYCRWGQPNLYTNVSTSKLPTMDSDDSTNNGTRAIDGLETLLQWMEIDPVDEWEMARNDQTENFQGNRNVFIDYPEFAWLIFNEDVPADYATPSGEASNSGSTPTYTVTATSNNSAYGTVSVSGYTITATPKTGYEVSGYTVTSGTATVTQNGNVFTVTPSSDCTVRINFQARTSYTVHFSVPAGVSQGSLSTYAGESITLPTPTGTPTATAQSYSFLGWVTASVTDSTTRPTVYYAGNSYTPTASTTLYALYTYTSGYTTYYTTVLSNACSHSYTSVVTAPTCTEDGYTTHTCTLCGVSYIDSTVAALGHNYVSNVCTNCGATLGDDCYVLTTSLSGGDQVVIVNVSYNKALSSIYTGYYNTGVDVTPTDGVISNPAEDIVWTVGINADGNYTFSTASGSKLSMDTAYTSMPLDKANNTWTITAAPTTADAFYVENVGRSGYYLEWYSSRNYWSAYYSISSEALFAVQFYAKVTDEVHTHSYTAVVTPPTCTEDGYTTYTCVCGDSYIADPTPATDHIDLDENYICDNCGNPFGYGDWILSTTAPTVGNKYIIAAYDDSTRAWYALTTENVYAPTSAGSVVLVSNNTILDPYDYVIFGAKERSYTSGSSTWTGVGFHEPENRYCLHLGNAYISVTSGAANAIFSFTPGTTENTFIMKSDVNGRYLTFDKGSFGISAEAGTELYFFYKPCDHDITYINNAEEPTCTTVGSTGTTKCSWCGTTLVHATEIPMLEHSYDTVVTEPTCTEGGYTTYTCTVCSDTYTADLTEATGHDYTYTNNSENHTVGCSNGCGYSATEDHTYVDGSCICGAEEVVIPTEPTEVTIKIGHTVSFDSDLKMNYRIKYTDLAAAVPNYTMEGAYLTVEKDRYPKGGGAMTVETVTLYPDLTTDSTRVLFSLPGIQSVEMGSELRAVLHVFDSEGNEYVTAVDIYSILAYAELCFNTYNPSKDGLLFTMLIDCLNYGAAAQAHFDRRADEPVNAGLDAYQQYASTQLSAELTDVRTYVDNDRSITAVSKMGFNVTFADKTEINAKLTIAEGYSKEDITSVKVLNEAGEVVDTLTQFTDLDDGRIQVTFTGVKSANMRDMYYFVAYVGDQVASQNVGYSIEAYAKSNIGSADAALAALVRNCIYYGDSAKVYFDSLIK